MWAASVQQATDGSGRLQWSLGGGASWQVDPALRVEGSEGFPFPTIVASGPRSALPHAPRIHMIGGQCQRRVGGIRTLDDATRLIQAGAEKVSVNSAAVKNPNLILEISRKFGLAKEQVDEYDETTKLFVFELIRGTRWEKCDVEVEEWA